MRVLPSLLHPDRLIAATLAGSAGLLAGAFFFQHVMGLAPCPLCIWQRWPHVGAIVLTGAALLRPGMAKALIPLAILALATGAGIAGYHVGVEQGWWTSATCGTPDLTGGSAVDLLRQLQAAPMVACDAVVWSLGGVSMAGWNGLASLGLAGLLVAAWRGMAAGRRGAVRP